MSRCIPRLSSPQMHELKRFSHQISSDDCTFALLSMLHCGPKGRRFRPSDWPSSAVVFLCGICTFSQSTSQRQLLHFNPIQFHFIHITRQGNDRTISERKPCEQNIISKHLATVGRKKLPFNRKNSSVVPVLC